MRQDELATARRWFAEELRFVSRVRSDPVIAAFASVPREHFAGPGPWRVLSPMYLEGYWSTANADPRHLYHDVLIAIDEARRLNNGQPSLWAFLYDQLDVAVGAHVVHVGIGTGYYTAILAEIVGPTGKVTAVEIDAALAARARTNLAMAWPWVNVVTGDGFAFRPDQPADVMIINAGVTHLSLGWLDSLAADGGRLLVPLTGDKRFGFSVLITRPAGQATRYDARHLHRIGIIDCIGGRDPEAEARLEVALQREPPTRVRSLRRAPDQPDAACWLAGDGWWLSTAPIEN